MRAYLGRLGYPVNRKRVQRLMQKMGLASVAPKPSTSKPAPKPKIYWTHALTVVETSQTRSGNEP